ncbi:biotin--[acetyl-CoA-carboxylase] ligase [Streptococcus cuniculipharyngis]|uniref:biotin--[biotin carboxyl-carrier protein] ligase n=1 Tax=Streptococcus cuniculipharyngis TaxID=1562651 RepID=A0A5C5SC89_9STRE|nr:biotin--[acetyl-CoA-carboxylase] ligase [Streptococcus cuniculipharyngis]TWS98707.1 biotin--[acetyl-CoA-carboxylase] ligase [Streptococcus cuniculipharyngis]
MLKDYLDPETIRQQVGWPVYFKEKSSSTQTDAREGIQKNHACPALYLADGQEQAVGRFGRPFYTEDQGGIYMTLHLKPTRPLSQLAVYTMMIATSIVKAIEGLTQQRCQIKWVNDIYLNQKKIAGILLESIHREDQQATDLLIGVGINFAISTFPPELASKAGSLFQEHPSISRSQLICEIWRIFQETPEQDLIKVYRDKSMVLDQLVSFTENGQTFQGLAIDISQKGELIVQLANHETKILSSNEVSLSSWLS